MIFPMLNYYLNVQNLALSSAISFFLSRRTDAAGIPDSNTYLWDNYLRLRNLSKTALYS
ncbi:hypothetical protein D1AOALGA4SA_3664 [Olavius algarvensis Delta 1 endosymbiont]|nr:hypothetical protein D1AOALGA4SA_3664 [Olavius algarvensis Delta 1 endosymbiont]